MKSVLICSLSACLLLTACESVPAMSKMENFDWSSLNPFNQEPVREVRFRKAPTAPTNEVQAGNEPITEGAALQTEMAEIEKLTGERPSLSVQNDGPLIPIPEEEPTETTKLPIEKPTKPDIMTNDPEVIATASIDEAESAPAAPKGEVKAVPTKESILWNRPVAKTTPNPTQPQTENTPSSVQSLAITLAKKKEEKERAEAEAEAKAKDNVKTTASETPESVATATATTANGCPQLRVLPVAQSLTRFYDGELNGEMTSRASIVDVNGGCEAVEGGMEIDLNIIMKGEITNAGRYNNDPSLEAFVTYPYFVSVISPVDGSTDKEIMATAHRFKSKIDTVDHAEQITHFIPMDDLTEAENYIVTVGFQLNRKELEHNRAHTIVRDKKGPASPDVSPARVRSLNPFSQ